MTLHTEKNQLLLSVRMLFGSIVGMASVIIVAWVAFRFYPNRDTTFAVVFVGIVGLTNIIGAFVNLFRLRRILDTVGLVDGTEPSTKPHGS